MKEERHFPSVYCQCVTGLEESYHLILVPSLSSSLESLFCILPQFLALHSDDDNDGDDAVTFYGDTILCVLRSVRRRLENRSLASARDVKGMRETDPTTVCLGLERIFPIGGRGLLCEKKYHDGCSDSVVGRLCGLTLIPIPLTFSLFLQWSVGIE